MSEASETFVRGLIEQTIDHELSDIILEGNYLLFKTLKDDGFLSDIESAMFGRVVGVVFDTNLSLRTRLGLKYDVDSIQNVLKILVGRGATIRAKIREYANR